MLRILRSQWLQIGLQKDSTRVDIGGRRRREIEPATSGTQPQALQLQARNLRCASRQHRRFGTYRQYGQNRRCCEALNRHLNYNLLVSNAMLITTPWIVVSTAVQPLRVQVVVVIRHVIVLHILIVCLVQRAATVRSRDVYFDQRSSGARIGRATSIISSQLRKSMAGHKPKQHVCSRRA